MQHKECQDAELVERVVNIRIDGLENRLKDAGANLAQMQRDLDSAVGDLWKNIRESMEDMNKVISEHAKADTTAMHNIETNLLTRVPAWALTVMTIGASIIGAMAMYILDHLKQ